MVGEVATTIIFVIGMGIIALVVLYAIKVALFKSCQDCFRYRGPERKPCGYKDSIVAGTPRCTMFGELHDLKPCPFFVQEDDFIL